MHPQNTVCEELLFGGRGRVGNSASFALLSGSLIVREMFTHPTFVDFELRDINAELGRLVLLDLTLL